jgi:hypothetical protein
MLKMLILVCSTAVSPANCQLETALDIIQGPQVASIFECGMASQVLVAQTLILQRSKGEYMKVKCSPAKAAEAPLLPEPAAVNAALPRLTEH